MPHLTGIFAEFPDADKIPPENIASWLKDKPQIHPLTNFLGNRLIYPQTIALTSKELDIDFAILREAIRQKPDTVFDLKKIKIFLPQLFVDRFPPISRLAGAILDVLNFKGVVQILIKNNNDFKIAGTLIAPEVEKLNRDMVDIDVEINGVKTRLKLNSRSISNITTPKVKIKIGEITYDVSGGVLGVIIDLRPKTANE